MRRTLTLLTAVVVLSAPVRAQDDLFEGRPLSHWLERVKGEKAVTQRQAALLVVGTGPASMRHWQPIQMARARQGGVIALQLIGPTKSPAIIPAIAAALRDDPEENVRMEAAAALTDLGVRAVVPDPSKTQQAQVEAIRMAFIAALKSDKQSGRVKARAAAGLGKFGEEGRTAIGALAEALKGADYPTRAAAADAIRRIGTTGKEPIPALLEAAREASPQLQAALKDDKADSLSRMQAALALGAIGAVDAVPTLSDVFGNEGLPEEVRKAAGTSLGLLSKDAGNTVPVLAKVLVSKASPEVRRAAAGALDRMGPSARDAIPQLVEALKDRDRFVRCLAMHALGQMGKEFGSQAKAIVTAIVDCTTDPGIEVRISALETLGNLGPDLVPDDVKDLVKRLSEDSQRDIRDAAQAAYLKLRPKP